jgi:hypothetical protein
LRLKLREWGIRLVDGDFDHRLLVELDLVCGAELHPIRLPPGAAGERQWG